MNQNSHTSETSLRRLPPEEAAACATDMQKPLEGMHAPDDCM